MKALFGGSNREGQLLVYPWSKNGPLAGKVVLFHWVHSSGTDVHGAVRKKTPPPPLSWPNQLNQHWRSMGQQMSQPDHPHVLKAWGGARNTRASPHPPSMTYCISIFSKTKCKYIFYKDQSWISIFVSFGKSCQSWTHILNPWFQSCD